ncbi:MAG: hypothetical protein INR71_07685, partial [Terriglobus roseus]|nr:hypothetical protein [Terriglobus roseus]
MDDAFATGDAIALDAARGLAMLGGDGAGWDGVRPEARRRGLRRTSWADWRAIDAVERERGRQRGKPREKILSVDEMLAVLDGA